MKKLLLSTFAVLAMFSAFATDYYWAGGAGSSATTVGAINTVCPTAPGGTRNASAITFAATDRLIFDGTDIDGSAGSLTGTTAITFRLGGSITVGQFILQNTVNVTYQCASSGNNIITGGTIAGADFVVGPGSAFLVSGSTTVVTLGAGTTGSVSGSIILGAGSNSQSFLVNDASGLIVNSGGSIENRSNLAPFGTSGTANTVIFASGSTFIQGSGAANPFQLTAPSSKVNFQTGSLFKVTFSTAPAFNGRTYANFEWANSGTQSATGGAGVTMDNLTVSAGTLNLNLTGTMNIKGNISVPAGTLTFTPATATSVVFNGTTAQSVSKVGTLTFAANASVVIANTAADVTFGNTQTISGTTTVNASSVLAASAALTLSGAVTVNGLLRLNSGGSMAASSSLTLGSAGTANGTWGATGSGATFINNTFFAGTGGVVTVATNTAATPTVTVTNTTPYTFTGSPTGPNAATNTGTGTSYTFSYVGTGGTTYGPSATQPTASGTYTATATVAASTDGFWKSNASAASAFTIAGGTPTIAPASNTFTAFTTTFGTASAAQTVAVTGTNLTADISVSAGTGFEVSNGGAFGPSTTFTQTAGNASGTLSVRLAANASAGGSYNNVTAATLTSTGATTRTYTTSATGNSVAKATPTATLNVTNTPQPYTGAGQSATVGIVSSSVPGSTSNISTGGAATQTNAGSYAVTADFVPTDAVNYNTLTGLSAGSFVISKATPTATLNVTNTPQPYTGAGQSATVGVVTSSTPGSTSNISTGGAATQTNAGSYAVTADFVPTDAVNYNTLTGLSAGSFVISKATPTATLNVTNTPQPYTGAGQSATVGVVTSSTPGSTSNISTGGAATQTNAGSYAVTADFVPTDAANYNTLTALSAGSFVISPLSVVVTPDAGQSKAFGAANPTYTYTFAPALVSPDVITGLLGRTAGEAVGTYAYNIGTLTAGANYSLSIGGSNTFQIVALGQGTADFRSKASGNFTSMSGVWEYDQGGGVFVDATQAPLPTNSVSITHSITLDQDYTVGAGKTFVLGTGGTLSVSAGRTLSVTGSANFGGNAVTFVSNASGTASLGEVSGTLSGATNVTVERYIPDNGFRSWRLLSVPVATSQTIRQAWQEGDANPNAKDNNLPGRGTQITGVFATQAAAAAAGFDSTSVNAAMLRWSGSAWASITSTSQPLNSFSSYFLYIRGERSLSVTGAASNSSATTLRARGTVFTGDQANSIGANAFGLVPNLYPSAINFTGLARTGGVNNLFYIWDSKKLSGNSLGVYQTFSGTNSFNCLVGGGSYVLGQPNTTIESGQSFFVTSGAAGTVTLRESAKISGTSGSLGFRPAGAQSKLDTRLYSSAGEMLDANTVVFDAAYDKTVAGEDAPKMGNPGANFAIERDNKLLAVEGTQPVKENDAIQFRVWNISAGTYSLEIEAQRLSLPEGVTAILEDSYLKTNTAINLAATNKVAFTVNQDARSSSANRFKILFVKAKAAATNSSPSYTVAPNPVENGTVNLQLGSQPAGKYAVRIVGAGGQAVWSGTISHAGGSARQSISLPAGLAGGTYTVEVVAPDKTRSTQTVLINRK